MIKNINTQLQQAVSILKNAEYAVAFTGAGMSVESGIPPFRGEGGIWNRYDPDSLELDFYRYRTRESWKVIREVFYDFFTNKDIKPNKGHYTLAKWEEQGWLKSVITQNIDDLHHIAGSKVVYEFHGNSARFVCMGCGRRYPLGEIEITDEAPRCPRCNGLLKPDFIFFGEGIPEYAYSKSVEAAHNCDVFIIIGTSGQVSPANSIPYKAKASGAKIIEINYEPSLYTEAGLSDVFLRGKSGEILPQIDRLLNEPDK